MAGPQSAGGALRLKQCADFADFGRNPADFGPQLAIGGAYGLAARPARRGRCGHHACLFWAALAAGKGVSQAGFSAKIAALGCFFFIFYPVVLLFENGVAP
jgi:hypothetical protein